MKNLFTLLLFFVINYASFAQPEWQLLSPTPTKYSLNSVSFPNAQEGWAVGHAQTILHTSNGGDTWEVQRDEGQGMFSGVFFVDSLTGWTVGWNSIYHTVDGGVTWEKQIKPSWPGDLNDVFFINHDTGWIVGYYKIILRTTDGGEHWNRIMSSTKEEKHFFSVCFADSLHGFAVGGSFNYTDPGLVMFSEDGGQSWVDKTPEGAKCFNKVTFVNANTAWICGNNGQLYKTTDGGNSWIDYSFNTYEEFNDIHFFDSLRGALLLGIYGGVRLTFDGGETWGPIIQTSSSSSSIHTTSFSSGADNILVTVGSIGYVSKSIDGGTTWNQLSKGGEYSFGSIGFFDDQNGLAITGYWNAGWLLRTHDGGETWNIDTIIDNGPFYKIYSHGGNWFLLNNNSQMMKSIDNGDSWTLLDLPDVVNYYYDLQFLNQTLGFMCGDQSTLVKTTDGGVTWEPIDFAQTYTFTKLFFTDENHGWLIEKNSKTIMRTVDGGNSWSFTKLKEDIYVFEPKDLYFIDNNTGFASTRDGVLFKTTDGGETWQQSYVFYQSDISQIKFINDVEGWYFCGSSAFHTYDGGETWINRQQFGLSIRNSFFFDNGVGWVCGRHGLIAKQGSWVGIGETTSNNATLLVFPNPATSKISISLPDNTENIYSLTVYNMAGQQVKSNKGINRQGNYIVDVSGLQSGTYIVKVSTSLGERLAKFVVQ